MTQIELLREDYEDALRGLVAIPSVSSSDEGGDCRRCAEAAAALIRRFGGEARIIETGGLPGVHGRIRSGSGAPKVVIYNHLDVQPAPVEGWSIPDPFLMEIRDDGTYLGRGTTDDKGPALAALFGAVLAGRAGTPVDVELIWELEEEIGSPSFGPLLDALPAGPRPDVVAVSDTIWVSTNKPAMPYGLRGVLTFYLRLETSSGGPTHSGLTGGLARNPFAEIASLVSQCADARTGAILIPGVYDDVRPLDDEEREGFAASGWSAEAFRTAHRLNSLRSDDPADAMERIWARPTFELHGITGGYEGPGIMTAVPPRAEAKCSMRLVPDQKPERIFELVRTFVAQRNPDVEVVFDAKLEPFLGPRTGRYAEAAAAAVESAFGVRPAFTREGGSIGAVVTMQEKLGAPIVLMGLSLPEHNYHGVDENFSWRQASRGMVMFRGFLGRVAGL
ncbi:MAG: peptidase [Gemmatimonadetes bacterium]|nr:peptidase [Gemmatimonadota bacterium]